MSTPPTNDAWILRRPPNPRARLRLFCFPYAGGGASIFRTWQQSLPPEVDVCPVQLPGREGRLRDAPFDRLAPLVRTLADVLAPWMEMPFAFYGYSNGALIGFELARELRRRGAREPVHLFAAACPAPHLPDPDPPIHDLPDDELVAELRRLNGTPEEILENREIMQLLIPLLRADAAVHETYVHGEEEPLDVPITAIGGSDDPKAARDDMAAWSRHTRAGFELRMVAGDHFFVHSAQALVLRDLAHDLQEVLRRIREPQRA
ncbi:MAG TPA: thioesterase domain-containing protein [Longimicrobiaceae bacterium]|nr:thioesterase domain-containing protein [Longimicrobiaceae bacterium]